ncbi:MAG: CPBP family intramembrane metalloprotease [Candidatus Krumholzibacteriota bacterium]|nr:CPBP family intramembrane metalloprotease [Candidatus Krumholzibacteriota bacterium]
MIEADSWAGLLLQCAVLAALGALVALLARLLRFRRITHPLPAPRAAALWSLLAVGLGWVLVIGLLFALAGGEPARHQESREAAPAGPGDVVGQLFVALVVVVPVLLVMRWRREPFASAGVSTRNLGRSLVVSAFLVAAAFACWFLAARSGGSGAPVRLAGSWSLLQFAVVGFAEEFAFRGYLQTRLVGWLGTQPGWIVASVLMAMAHAGHRVATLGTSGGSALLGAASLVPISLFLGFVMLRTRSIIAPGLLHTFINWLNL